MFSPLKLNWKTLLLLLVYLLPMNLVLAQNSVPNQISPYQRLLWLFDSANYRPRIQQRTGIAFADLLNGKYHAECYREVEPWRRRNANLTFARVPDRSQTMLSVIADSALGLATQFSSVFQTDLANQYSYAELHSFFGYPTTVQLRLLQTRSFAPNPRQVYYAYFRTYVPRFTERDPRIICQFSRASHQDTGNELPEDPPNQYASTVYVSVLHRVNNLPVPNHYTRPEHPLPAQFLVNGIPAVVENSGAILDWNDFLEAAAEEPQCMQAEDRGENGLTGQRRYRLEAYAPRERCQ